MAFLYKDKRGRYRIQYTDATGKRRDVKGFMDLKSTKQEAARLEDRTIKQQRGTYDALEESVSRADARPLSAHITDWTKHLSSKGRGVEYVKQQGDRVTEILITELHYKRISQIRTDEVQVAVKSQMGELGKGTGEQTASHFIQALKQFGKWLWKPGMRARGPLLDELVKYAVTQQRRPKAEYTQPQLAALIDAAEKSAEYRFNIAGKDRAMVYRLAIATGFRRKELNALTPAHLNLELHTVSLEKGESKNKKLVTHELPPDFCAALEPWLKGRPRNTPLFRLPKHSARMIRRDFKAANVVFPSDGKSRDFHCLRHTAISNWVRHAPNLKIAQELARHSDIKLTMRYTHTTDEERRDTVARAASALQIVRTEADRLGQGKGVSQSGDEAGKPKEETP